MWKKWIVPVLALLASLGAAAPSSALGPVTVGLSADYVTRYIWRGFDLLPDNNPAFQPSGTVTWAATETLSVFGSVWASYGITDTSDKPARDKNRWDEIDYTVGAEYTLDDTWSFHVGQIYYHFPPASDSDLKNTKEVYAGAAAALPWNLSTGLTVYYDYDNGKGVYANWAVDYSRPLSGAVAVAAGFSLGYMHYTEDDPDKGFYVAADGDAHSTFSDANLSLGVEVDLGYGFTLANTAYYTTPLGQIRDDQNDNDEFWLNLSLSCEF